MSSNSVSFLATREFVNELKLASLPLGRDIAGHMTNLIHLSIKDGIVTLRSFNFSVYFTSVIQVTGVSEDIDLKVAFDKRLLKIIKPGSLLTLGDNFINVDGISFVEQPLGKLDKHDQPEIDPLNATIELPQNYFDNFSTCTEFTVLNSPRLVLGMVNHKNGSMTATNGLFLSSVDCNIPIVRSMNIPASTCKLLVSAFKEKTKLCYDKDTAQYSDGVHTVTIKLSNERFPDTDRLFKEISTTVGIILDTKKWINVLKSCISLEGSRWNQALDFTFTQTECSVSRQLLGGRLDTLLPFRGIDFSDKRVSLTLNAGFMLKILEHAGEDPEIVFGEGTLPTFITSTDKTRKFFISPIIEK